MEHSGTILLIGALDTKGQEYAFVKAAIEGHGLHVMTMNIGVMGDPVGIAPDWDAEAVAQAAGKSLTAIREKQDRGWAMTVMSEGAARLARELYEQGIYQGVLGMGGTGGTSVISSAMKQLPVGFPKVLVSTAASGDTRAIVGTKDIVLIPSVVDVAGINRISRHIFEQAAGAVCGMVRQREAAPDIQEDKPIIAITMFGNTTECVNRCVELLSREGYESLVFHCTGTGGRTMEDLVLDGLVTAVLDITTTEWADELCGGVFAAGPNRLEAAGRAGIPHLIVPGCIDMVNFGGVETVPDKYKERRLYVWNPNVTLMRTNVEENRQLGQIFAEKANKAAGPIRVLLPKQGVSILDSPGQEFWWPEADQAMYEALKAGLRPDIEVEEADLNINDEAFSTRAVELLLAMIRNHKQMRKEEAI